MLSPNVLRPTTDRNIDASYPQIFSDVTWLPSVDISARVYLGESSIRHNKAGFTKLEFPTVDDVNPALP